MCGIAGIVKSDRNSSVSAESVRQMCDCIVYRGPDSEGIWAENQVGLGMRRLSIIDLVGGTQPIYNEDRSIVTVFNGEIYNFRELRSELEKRGHHFYSSSDTEAIVHLYEEFGNGLVDKLRGMFAFALYDNRNRKLLLARDRMGKKPLHYAIQNGTLYFGSEIKSLLKVAPQLEDIDHTALMQFFYYGYIPDPLTAFAAVRKLPPGYWLEFVDGNATIHRYWDLPPFASSSMPEQECLQRMEAILSDAVRLRLVSDVPIGALLSGGVDSSTIVALMARNSNVPVKTFTIKFGREDFNEAPYARAVAKAFGTEHCELAVEPDLWDTLQTLTGILDEPFADSSVIPTYHVSRLARQHVTVVLSGDGGDELFAGYNWYSTNYRRRYFGLIPEWAGKLYQKAIYPSLPLSIKSRKLAYNIALNARDRFIDGISFISPRGHTVGLLTKEFTESALKSAPESVAQGHFDRALATDLVSQMQYTDMKMYMTADILTKVDRMSMAASLEVRTPLLDHLFSEFAVQLPVGMKLRGGTRKYLLRRLAERLGVPKEVLCRPKQGFALPLVHWMRSEMKNEITSLLLEPRTLQRGYYRRAGIERILIEHNTGRRDHSGILWQLLAFELWHRNYLNRRIASVHDPMQVMSSC